VRGARWILGEHLTASIRAKSAAQLLTERWKAGLVLASSPKGSDYPLLRGKVAASLLYDIARCSELTHTAQLHRQDSQLLVEIRASFRVEEG
jgi:hypothetical protein